ncbi:hypothetical protein ACSHDS_003236 [Vibrio alginolyticus]
MSEIHKPSGVSTEQVHIHYNTVFNSEDWTKENEFETAVARSTLRQDVLAELAKTTPDMRHLLAMAKQDGLRLVNESD